jgi:hypothetical protein
MDMPLVPSPQGGCLGTGCCGEYYKLQERETGMKDVYECVEYSLLRCNVFHFGESPIFRRISRLILQGLRVNQARNHHM